MGKTGVSPTSKKPSPSLLKSSCSDLMNWKVELEVGVRFSIPPRGLCHKCGKADLQKTRVQNHERKVAPREKRDRVDHDLGRGGKWTRKNARERQRDSRLLGANW